MQKSESEGDSKMKETMDTYTFDVQQLLQIPETRPVCDPLSVPQHYHREKKGEVLIIAKNLSADHLTATYWG